MGPDNYTLTQTYPVEGGVNRALIRSTTKPGTIVIKASTEGLREATLTLSSKPFIVNDGLAATLPADGLPVYLKKQTPLPCHPERSEGPERLAIKCF